MLAFCAAVIARSRHLLRLRLGRPSPRSAKHQGFCSLFACRIRSGAEDARLGRPDAE
jgi:hypothetical protein